MLIRPLPGALQKKAEVELNEVTERIQDDLRHVKDWVEKQPHLNIRTDEQLFLSFLRGCKFSLQKFKEKLDCYHTIRTLVTEIFHNRDPFQPELQEILNKGTILPLPKTQTPTGPRILLFRWKPCNPETVTFINIIKVYFMIIDILVQEDDECMVSGLQCIADYGNFSYSYMLQMTPNVLHKTIYSLQTAYPVRIKGILCINIPSVFETILGMVKPFMSEKLKKRMHAFPADKLDEFYEFVPRELLPEEYGGGAGSLDKLTAEWKAKIESYKNWFKEEEKYGTNEKLRLGEAHLSVDVFGVEGTFRKLNID